MCIAIKTRLEIKLRKLSLFIKSLKNNDIFPTDFEIKNSNLCRVRLNDIVIFFIEDLLNCIVIFFIQVLLNCIVIFFIYDLLNC